MIHNPSDAPNATALEGMSSKPLAQRFLHVLSYFALPRFAWIALTCAVLLGAVLEPAIPALLKPLLDSGFKSQQMPIAVIPVAIIGLFMLRSSATFLSDLAVAKIAQTGLLDLRKKMFNAITVAEFDLYRRQPATALANTVVFEATSGAILLLQSVTTLVKDSLAIIALSGYLLYLNWKLTLIVLFIFPAVGLAMRALAKRVYQLTKASQTAVDQLAYVVEENVLAHREVRIQAAQEQQKARFDSVNVLLHRLAMKSAVAGSAVAPVTNFFGSIALSAVITVAVMQSQSSDLSAGGFVAFVTAMLMLIAPIKHLSELTSTITRGVAAAERAINLVETVRPEVGGDYLCDRCTGQIVFEQVGATYPDAKTPALTDINLRIASGQFIALVGLSGSGKTSLASLLPRFLDYNKGSVKLDGVELTQWNLQSLRQQFALVGQQVVMFNDTVLNNIALGQPIDRERAQRCLTDAYLSELVASFPSGLDTVLGHNASMLSGGERQRLAIARALYKDAPILILDEATSALDADTDSLVQAALRAAMVNRTTVAIAHRLSTIRDAHWVVVLQGGRIVQQGTHDALATQPGAYQDFMKISYASANS